MHLLTSSVSILSFFEQASKAKEVARLERLQQEADTARREATRFRARPIPKSVSRRNAPSFTQSSPVLLGLNILSHAPSIDTSGSENIEPQVVTPRKQQPKLAAYEPHSTVRAKKRASFDERRALHELEREEEQQRLRKTTIKQRRAELSRLARDSLR